MEKFEAALKKATAKGASYVPGAIVAVVDRDGNTIYSNVAGYNGVAPDAQPLEFDQTFFLASCTKLVTSIAALQTVERGLITLDAPLDKLLPELAAQPIIVADVASGSGFSLHPATQSITLRHLLTHSAGTTYDVMDPLLQQWRKSRGEPVQFSSRQNVEEDFAYPRTYEAGEGWRYGGGLDWAGLLVARLNKTTLEEYIQENIAKPLGITTFTFHLDRKPHVAEKIMHVSTRQDDGTMATKEGRAFPEPIGESGGHGMYASVRDYTRVLADLLKEEPVLLKKASVDLLFTPQFTKGSKALEALYANNESSYRPIVGGSIERVVGNHGLGGYLVEEAIEREEYSKPGGTLTWSGMPNLLWSVNREKGLGLFFATQVLPFDDEGCQKLSRVFETEVWRSLGR